MLSRLSVRNDQRRQTWFGSRTLFETPRGRGDGRWRRILRNDEICRRRRFLLFPRATAFTGQVGACLLLAETLETGLASIQ